ncbi:MAG: GIDE domain-containing protein [Myxococcota bacterium]
MFAIGLILLLIGGIALIGGLLQKYRAGRVLKTPLLKTGEVQSRGPALEKRAVSAEGRLITHNLVTAPVSGTQCLFYRYSVVAEWKSGDQKKTLLVEDGQAGASFSLDDGSGPVPIEPGRGGDFDLETTFKKTSGQGLKSIAAGGLIPFGDHGFSVAPGQRIKGIKIPNEARYRVEERAMLPAEKLYANGRLTDDGKIGSPKIASLMLSKKLRDELLASTGSLSKKLLIGGASATALGGILAVVGQLMTSA